MLIWERFWAILRHAVWCFRGGENYYCGFSGYDIIYLFMFTDVTSYSVYIASDNRVISEW
jgi:hypothetical protein